MPARNQQVRKCTHSTFAPICLIVLKTVRHMEKVLGMKCVLFFPTEVFQGICYSDKCLVS
jgi:hypothetical protein